MCTINFKNWWKPKYIFRRGPIQAKSLGLKKKKRKEVLYIISHLFKTESVSLNHFVSLELQSLSSLKNWDHRGVKTLFLLRFAHCFWHTSTELLWYRTITSVTIIQTYLVCSLASKLTDSFLLLLHISLLVNQSQAQNGKKTQDLHFLVRPLSRLTWLPPEHTAKVRGFRNWKVELASSLSWSLGQRLFHVIPQRKICVSTDSGSPLVVRWADSYGFFTSPFKDLKKKKKGFAGECHTRLADSQKKENTLESNPVIPSVAPSPCPCHCVWI